MTEATTTKPLLLVVDDSRLMRVAAHKILANEFEILDAEDGEAAWETLQDNQQVALVMSDLSMPNLDGLGLLKKIRSAEQPHLRELPVIIVTGAEDDDGSKATALAAGASDFITKPFESLQLLARTKAQARHQRMQQELRDSHSVRAQLEQQQSLDLLTQLPNRASFTNSAEEQLAYAIRHRTELSLFVVRVERYKVLFLRQGKQVAEEVVSRIAALARQGRRREDVVGRIELDTLAVLLPSSNPIVCAKICDQLRQAAARLDFSDLGIARPVKFGLGMATLPIRRDLQAAELIDDALQALKRSDNARAAAPRPSAPSGPHGALVTRGTPAMATPQQVQHALQALAQESAPTLPSEQYLRAILPLLHFWNNSHANRHHALVDALAHALTDEADSVTATADPTTTKARSG